MDELLLIGDEAVAPEAVPAGLTAVPGGIGLNHPACRAGREAARP